MPAKSFRENITMTEKEKMLAGELYIAEEAELAAEHARAIELCDRLDCGGISEEERDAITRQLLGKCGKNTVLGRGLRCDYGYNIEAGENFYVNFNVVILDVCKVKIGDNCLIAPQAGIYTAAHPLDPTVRRSGLEYGRPVTIGNDVWIGGGARILPGVTLGDNVVVGAGAVVTKSFPSNVVIAGNPARVIKKL